MLDYHATMGVDIVRIGTAARVPFLIEPTVGTARACAFWSRTRLPVMECGMEVRQVKVVARIVFGSFAVSQQCACCFPRPGLGGPLISVAFLPIRQSKKLSTQKAGESETA